MTRKHRRHLRSKWRSLYVWHRYLGLTAALFMLLISATGLLLNHTEQLNLDERYTTSETLLNHYSIRASHPISFPAGRHWISLIDGTLFFDTQIINTSLQSLAGAVQLQNIIAFADQASIHLLTSEGELIEVLSSDSGIPQPVVRIGTADDSIVIQSGEKLFQLNEDLTSVVPAAHEIAVNWSAPATLPANIQQPVVQKTFATALPVERVLLDLHSGRLFGSMGVYVFDLIALLFIFLSISGSTIWLKQHIKSRQHRKKHQQHHK